MRANGIVSKWSDNPPHPPYVTVSIGLVCLAILLIYYGVSPVLQQAMIEVGGMHPSRLAQILEQTAAAWWDVQPFRDNAISPHIAPASRMMAPDSCGWPRGWTQSHGRSYG